MNKYYWHYEALWPVIVGPSSEDGLLLSMRPAEEEPYSRGWALKRKRRIFKWEGERKAGLLMEDENETLKWQKMGAALCKQANDLLYIPPGILPGEDDDDLPEPVLICDNLGEQKIRT